MFLLLLLVSFADLEQLLEQHCQPKIRLGQQNFRWLTLRADLTKGD